MPRNSSGVYSLPSGNPVVPGTTIDAAWANDTLEDMANEITNSLSRTGAGGMIAPFRIADGTITAPGLSYLNETNTGLYRSGAGSTWMSVLGSNVFQFSTVGVTIPFGKALTAQGNAGVVGSFTVGGAATFSSTLALTGALTASGGVVGNVTGNVTAASGTSSFNNVSISGSLDMDAGSSATITGLSTPTNASDAANKGYVDSQVATRLALSGGTMSGYIDMNGYAINGVATPSSDQDAANKAYVDSVAQGIDAKASCKAATVGNITLGGLQIVDSVLLAAGDRILVKDQTSAAQNGIYVVSAGSWARSSDANTWDELISAYTFVEQGSTNANNGYICTISAGGTLGTTPVTWAQFSGAGQIDAGTGMTKSGNTLNVNTAASSRIVVNVNDIDLATTGITAGTYRSLTVDAYGRATGGSNPTTLSGYGITDAYTTTQVDSALALKLNLTGGTMSGAIAMGANKITGLADPTNPQDAATKTYIDTIFGSTTSAAASAAAAASSASAAATSATNASNSATAAAGSATSAASSYTTFNNQYLGSKASDPTTNNTGGALVAGNLYWNSTANEMRVYTGSAWAVAYLPASGYMDLTTNQTAAGVKTFSSMPVLSAGNAQGITYLNASKAVTTSANFVLDTSGNLGVGTSAPKLRVQFSAATAQNSPTLGTAQGIAYLSNNDANYGLCIGNSASDGSAWLQAQRTDGTATAYAISLNPGGGNVGIGVAAPAAKLDLGGDYKELVNTANTSAAYTIAITAGTVQILTLTGNCTFTFPTAVAGKSFLVMLKQDATGSRTVTWPAAVKWPGSTAPTITATASKMDVYSFVSDGTNWYGATGGQNYL